MFNYPMMGLQGAFPMQPDIPGSQQGESLFDLKNRFRQQNLDKFHRTGEPQPNPAFDDWGAVIMALEEKRQAGQRVTPPPALRGLRGIR
jgi:hypothetical protein